VSADMQIQSHRGSYRVTFGNLTEAGLLGDGRAANRHLVDVNVARLHQDVLAPILDRPTTVLLEATEENKSLEQIIPVIEGLVAGSCRRDDVLVAVGGGNRSGHHVLYCQHPASWSEVAFHTHNPLGAGGFVHRFEEFDQPSINEEHPRDLQPA